MSELELLYSIAPFAVTLTIGLIGGWAVVKKRISAIRKLIDSVDDAVQDDSVSENEFREIWSNAKTLIKS